MSTFLIAMTSSEYTVCCTVEICCPCWLLVASSGAVEEVDADAFLFFLLPPAGNCGSTILDDPFVSAAFPLGCSWTQSSDFWLPLGN